MHRLRQSRRAACDRCRTNKLRCERVSAQDSSCQRCVRRGALCVITADFDSLGVSHASPSNRVGSKTSFTLNELRSINTSQGSQALDTSSQAGHRVDIGSASIELAAPVTQILQDSMDFTIADFAFADDPCTPVSLAYNRPQDDAHARRSSLDSTLLDDLSPFEGSVVAITTPSPTRAEGRVVGPLQDVLELSAQLAGNLDGEEELTRREFCPSASQPMQVSIQAALSSTSRFRDALGRFSNMEQSRSAGCDVLVTTAIVTTYIFLLRAWRRDLLKLLSFLTAPADIERPCILPSLQLGGFDVQSKPSTQAAVLLDLLSGMLQSIDAYIGIGSSLGSKAARDGRQVNQPAALRMDSVSVSVREMLLSQEMLRVDTMGGPAGLSLKGLMDEVRKATYHGR